MHPQNSFGQSLASSLSPLCHCSVYRKQRMSELVKSFPGDKFLSVDFTLSLAGKQQDPGENVEPKKGFKYLFRMSHSFQDTYFERGWGLNQSVALPDFTTLFSTSYIQESAFASLLALPWTRLPPYMFP